MATLALAAVGAAAGGALLPGGISLLGATLSGAAIGSQIGALAGSYVDNALFGASGGKVVEGPRLQKVHLTASTEGAPIPRIYGRARLGGQVIWADTLQEQQVRSSSGGSGKGLPSPGASTRSVEYRYSASFAVALCEGEISGLGRVWADGRELDIARLVYRLYTGSEDQAADVLISAKLGADAAPAFRGTAYIVFQDLPLAEFGNRIPQLSFEVVRTVDRFGEKIRGVVMIPGSGEFVYATEPVAQTFGLGRSQAENVHTLAGETDWQVAVDQMQTALPNVVGGVAGGELVRYRSARGAVSVEAGRGADAKGDGSNRMVRRGCGAGRRLCGEHARRPAGVWRHAVRSDSRGGDRGS